jgi:glycosyltransferase involved in cell wall biosynthesis
MIRDLERGKIVSKFLVGILTTRNVEKLERCIKSVNTEDAHIVVVVNSPDKDYYGNVKSICDLHGISVVETECNGTPGKGKNSVLDYFLNTKSYEYLIPIDGDDFYENGALKSLLRYVTILEPDETPDVIGQLENKMTYEGKETTWEEFSRILSSSTFAAKSKKNWRMLKQLNKLTEDILPFNRFLVLSSHAAKSFRYNEELKAADDYLAMFELYSQTPKINYFLLRDESLYHYDLQDGGTLHSFVSEDNAENMIPFFEKVNALDFSISKSIEFGTMK